MANRMFVAPRSLDKENILIQGTLVITGGAGAIASTRGNGFTASRTSAGLYRITLTDKYSQLLAAQVGMQEATLTAKQVKLKANDVVAGPTVDIQVSNGAGVAADPASGDEVYFSLRLKNSTAR